MSALSALYGRVAELRRSWYGGHPARQRHLPIPVISVGNLVVGGSGKTPVVAAVATLLQQAGERPAILSRGYGRRRTSNDPTVVSDIARVLVDVERSGDEPQMLARALPGVPVVVCADRFQAGQVALERFASTVAILDDGFQHLPLARTVDLLVVSPADLDEQVLPAGRLREPLRNATAADALLVPGSVDDTERVAHALGVKNTFRIEPHFDSVRRVRPFASPYDPGGARTAIGVAGIARPERFFDAAERGGWTLRHRLTYRDHHWFTPDDIKAAARVAHAADASHILTTEKDAVRLEGLIDEGGPEWIFMPMRVSIEPRTAFREWILSRVRQGRGGA